MQAEVRTLSGQLEETRQELTLEKRKCHLLEERASVGGGAGESRSVVSGGGGDGKAVAEKMAVLETKELNERQRADLAVLRQRQAQARAMGASFPGFTFDRAIGALFPGFTCDSQALPAIGR